MKSIFAFLIGFVISLFTFWLFGTDFNHRGFDIGFSFVVFILFGYLTYLHYEHIISHFYLLK